MLSGKRHTDGIEFETAGKLSSRWDIFGGLALMNARIDAATGDQANTLGKTPVNTPKYTANVWSTFKLDNRWKVGGGAEAVGKRYGNTSNINAAPAYVRWDGLLEYQQDSYAIKLNVFNLLDKDYYEGVYAGHAVPGTSRTFQVSMSTKF